MRAPEEHVAPKSALLVGIGRYDHPEILPALEGPRADIRSMQTVLRDAVIGGFDVEVLEDVDSKTACSHIEPFLSNRGEDETVVLYFSGHGFIDKRGALYLCTTDSTFERPLTSTIPASFLTGLIDACQSKRLVLILDCCYSGNFEGSAKAASVIEPQFQGNGLGRIVLTAGVADQLAWDAGTTGSIFTRHIVEGLLTGNADRDEDGIVTVNELYEYVYKRVTAEQPRQRPGKWSYREDGPSFVLARSPKTRQVELPQWLAHELQSEVASTRAHAVQGLVQILEGRDRPLRELAMTELRSLAERDDSMKVRSLARAALESGAATPVAASAVATSPVVASPVAPTPTSVTGLSAPGATPSVPEPPPVRVSQPPAPPPQAQLTETLRPFVSAPATAHPFMAPKEVWKWLAWLVPAGILLGELVGGPLRFFEWKFLPASLISTLIFTLWISVRYERHATLGDALTSPWAIAAATLTLVICIGWTARDLTLILFILSLTVPVILWRLGTRASWKRSLLFGFASLVVSGAISVVLAIQLLSASSYQWVFMTLAAEVINAAVGIPIALYARKCWMQRHGG